MCKRVDAETLARCLFFAAAAQNVKWATQKHVHITPLEASSPLNSRLISRSGMCHGLGHPGSGSEKEGGKSS
jgi:hypothetical protein